MRQILIYFVLFIPVISKAQFALSGYAYDSCRVHTLIDAKDIETLEILKENVRIFEITRDSMIAEVDNGEATSITKDLSFIMDVIYQNMDNQRILLESKIEMANQLADQLQTLKNSQHSDKKTYVLRNKEVGFEKRLKNYRKIKKELDKKEEQLLKEIIKAVRKSTEKTNRKFMANEFVKYVSKTFTGIGAVKVQPLLDSLEQELLSKTKEVEAYDSKLKWMGLQEYQLKNESKKLRDKLNKELMEQQSLVAVQKNKASKLEYQLKLAKQQKNIALYNLDLAIKERAEQERAIIDIENDLSTMQQGYEDLREERMELKETNDSLILLKAKFIEDNKILEQETAALITELTYQKLYLLAIPIVLALGWCYSAQKRRELKRTYAQLQDTKDQLIRRTRELELSHGELHHRIKNNLQKISNLIFIKSSVIYDTKAIEILENLQQELGTISLIHKKLYKNPNNNLTIIDIADYAEDIIKSVVGKAAKVSTNIESVAIEMDNAVEIGLILNELVTNACKYGFTNRNAPELKVEIYLKGRYLHLKVKDNGIGFPSDFNVEENASFGLIAMYDIVKRHENKGSTIKVYNDTGAVVELQLPYNSKIKRLIA